MNKGKLVAVLLIAPILLIAAVIGGQYMGGAYLLYKLGVHLADVSPLTLLTYWQAYADRQGVTVLIQRGFFISLLPVIPISVIIFLSMVIQKKKIEDLHGNARFATKAEIARAGMIYNPNKTHKYPPVLLGALKGNLFFKTKYIADYSQEYTTLSALPGAGKGVSFVVPNLLVFPGSVVNFDPKKENFKITAGYRSKVLGQKVFMFSPDAAEEDADCRTHCWNPVDYISRRPVRTLSDIKNITTILIPADSGENQSFYISAQAALNGILMYIIETPTEQQTMYRAYEINQAPMGIDKWIKNTLGVRQTGSNPLSDTCANLLRSYANESEKKRDTTKSIISTYLEVFNDEFVRAATSRSDFNFNDLRKEPITIFVGLAPPYIEKYKLLLNLFFSQCLTVNTMVLPDEGPKDKNGKPILKVQCMPLLDEFTALGRISIIQSSSGYTRAYDMRYACVFQNRSQVYADTCYGMEGGKALLETFHNEIVFAIESTSDAEDYSKRLGNTTLKDKKKSKTFSKDMSVTKNDDYHERALMLPQEIQRLPYDKQLIFKKGGKIMPIFCDKIVWYTDPFFKKRANMPTPEIPVMEFSRAARASMQLEKQMEKTA